MRLMREETFAPVLGVMRFGTEDEAVRLANDSPFGLNASVWTRDSDRSQRVVRCLETGNVYVNNVLTNVGNPYMPFGGVKASGIGRYHGPEGVRAFCAETSVMISPASRSTERNWFPHGDDKREALDELIRLRHGDLGWARKACGWFRLFRRSS
jgi:acyl-CoA reductase-like NAD-dependent aldehyde dehydrogenase